jgi:hypothetical protein
VSPLAKKPPTYERLKNTGDIEAASNVVMLPQ